MPLDLTEPYGPLIRAEYALAITLANCTEFQDITSSADETEALESIYFEKLPPPADLSEYTLAELEGYRPFALITPLTYDSRRVGSPGSWDDYGALMVQIERDVPEDLSNDDAAAMMDFKAILGRILRYRYSDDSKRGLLDLFEVEEGSSPGYLLGAHVTIPAMPERSDYKHRTKMGDYIVGGFIVEWGVR